jgi:hypothetical protein
MLQQALINLFLGFLVATSLVLSVVAIAIANEALKQKNGGEKK